MKRPQRGLNWHLNTPVWKGCLALLFSAYYPELAPHPFPAPIPEEPECPVLLAYGRRKGVQAQGISTKGRCPHRPASVSLGLGSS